MFMQMASLKLTQRVTILQTTSNQEEILKRLINMLPIAQKLYVECIYGSSNLGKMEPWTMELSALEW